MGEDGRVAVARDQSWARTLPARMAREVVICGVFRTIIRTYARRVISGRERLKRIHGPVLFVANHCSHVDTPLLLGTLPFGWRQRTAVVAAADYFYTSRVLATTVSLAFATVPLDRRSGRGTRSTASLEPLVDAGWSLVMFAEGTRSRDGRVGALRVGAATLAAEHRLPIVPIHVDGTHTAMPVGKHWMVRPEDGGPFSRQTIRISFGDPIRVAPDDDPFEVMERVRVFMAESGAETTPDPKLAERRTVALLAAGASEAGAAGAAGAGASGSVRPG